MKGKFPLAVVVCLFLVSIASAQSFLKVNEAETQSFFLQNRLQTKLAIENFPANFPARIRLEILNANDKILAQNETNKIINRGKQFLPIPLEFIGKQDANNLLWYRLRYVITPGNADVSTSGVISLSEIMQEIFELQILASDKVFAGMRLLAHLVAVHPLTKKPIKNVNIAGEVTLDLNNDSTENKLKNFSVATKPDKTFYLPEHKTAKITVSANYLFGKPVSAGKVRIVRETERVWNYNEQKYEIEEVQSYEGVLDEEGKFTAKIDLSEAHKKLAKDDWKRFEDLRFAAYFTDASTNRTEQKRFDVRVSKEAIHVYFLRYFEDVNPKLPFQFYVSTFYADGTPARCSLRVKGNYEEIKDEKILAEAKTNRYGAGKLERLIQITNRKS